MFSSAFWSLDVAAAGLRAYVGPSAAETKACEYLGIAHTLTLLPQQGAGRHLGFCPQSLEDDLFSVSFSERRSGCATASPSIPGTYTAFASYPSALPL